MICGVYLAEGKVEIGYAACENWYDKIQSQKLEKDVNEVKDVF